MIIDRKELESYICYYPYGYKRPKTKLLCRACLLLAVSMNDNKRITIDDVVFSRPICEHCTISGCTYANFNEVNNEK